MQFLGIKLTSANRALKDGLIKRYFVRWNEVVAVTTLIPRPRILKVDPNFSLLDSLEAEDYETRILHLCPIEKNITELFREAGNEVVSGTKVIDSPDDLDKEICRLFKKYGSTKLSLVWTGNRHEYDLVDLSRCTKYEKHTAPVPMTAIGHGSNCIQRVVFSKNFIKEIK